MFHLVDIKTRIGWNVKYGTDSEKERISSIFNRLNQSNDSIGLKAAIRAHRSVFLLRKTIPDEEYMEFDNAQAVIAAFRDVWNI